MKGAKQVQPRQPLTRYPCERRRFPPTASCALFGSDDYTVRLWDLDAKKELACFTGHTAAVKAVAFSPDGRRAASGSDDYTGAVWRLP